MPLNQPEIDLLHKRLTARRDHLLDPEKDKSDSTRTVELDQTSVGRLSRMDALQGQAMSKALKEREKIELQKISRALHRIEEGEYGICQQCREDIAIGRLELDPAAPLCINCASQSEKDHL